MFPIEFIIYPNKQHPINIVNIAYNFSYKFTGNTSPYPTVNIVVIDQYNEVMYSVVLSISNFACGSFEIL